MQPAEMNYNIYNKEMLVIILSLEEWWAKLKELQRTPFTIYLNYKALEYFIITKKLFARQAYWVEYLSWYYFKLMY
jgi:hypothetical protein